MSLRQSVGGQGSTGSLVISGPPQMPWIATELLDNRLRIVDRHLATGREIFLAPGRYFLVAYLPDGEVVAEVIDVRAEGRVYVDLRTPLAPEDERVFARWRPQPQLKMMVDFRPDLDVRFLAFKTLGSVESVSGIAIESPIVGAYGATSFTVSVPQGWPQRVFIAQVALRGLIPVNVMLPISGGAARSCQLTVQSTLRGARVFASLAHTWAESALSYVRNGLFREAQLVTNSTIARSDLDPIAALAIRLVELKTQDELGSDEAMDELLTNSEWLPDAGILAAERALRVGDEKLGLEFLERMRRLGLPVLTGYATLALARLSRLAGAESPDVASRARFLYQALTRWMPFTEPGAATLTITGADLADPSTSQRITPPIEEPVPV